MLRNGSEWLKTINIVTIGSIYLLFNVFTKWFKMDHNESNCMIRPKLYELGQNWPKILKMVKMAKKMAQTVQNS